MSCKPSIDQWLKDAKADKSAVDCGMYLTHNGTVRVSPKSRVREGAETELQVKAMLFSYDEALLEEIIKETRKLEGIYYVRAWLNSGYLEVGEDIMYVLIGGDIRPRVLDALQYIVGRIKNECVTETEIYY